MSSTGFDEYRHLTEAARRLEAYKRMEPSIQNDGKGGPCQITVAVLVLWTMVYMIWTISYGLYDMAVGLPHIK